MNRPVRLVDTDLGRPQLTAAIDEALLESRIAGASGDTVHLYRRRPPSVSIGYFLPAREVADVEACRRDGVPVVRRISGGGAIYTDERQLVYAIAFAPRRPVKAGEALALACQALARALGRLGVEGARMDGVNDVVAGGLKVSGSAQAIRRGVHLLHGTVLVDADLDAMTRYLLRLPKMEHRGHSTPATRVTTLARLLGAPPPMERVKEAVAAELAAAVGGAVVPGCLEEAERTMAEGLAREKYDRDEWNLRR